MSTTAFIAGLLLLLAPGPTNVLLATAGALEGWRGAFRLVPLVLAVYLGGVGLLALGLGPLIAGHGFVLPVLKIVCAGVVALIALRLWRAGAGQVAPAVTAGRTLAATAVNPKVFVFALAFLPADATGQDVADLLPVLAAMVAVSSSAWVLAGGVLASPGRRTALARTGAVALGLCAALITGSALG